MFARFLFFFMLLLGCGLPGARLANAQTGISDSDYADLKERVKQLEQLVSSLKQEIDRLEAAPARKVQEAPAVSPAQNPPTIVSSKPKADDVQPKEQLLVYAGRDTFTISSRDKLFRLRIGGQLQVDGKTAYDNKSYYSSNPHQLINNFIVRRVRPIFEGSLGKHIEFRIMPDFGNGKVLLFDAYADFKLKPYAVLRVGKMKTPLHLERLQSCIDMNFIERSLITNLAPNRDVGFQLYGDFYGRLSYQAAVLNGAPVGQSYDIDVNQGKDVVGRIFFTPFAPSGPKSLKGLGFGIAVSSGRQEGAVLPTFNTTGGQIPFFSYGSGAGSTAVVPAAAGRRLIYTPQLYYYNGPFGLMAEYIAATQKIAAVVDRNTIVQNISNHAWQVSGSWMLTGEKKSFNGLALRKGSENRDEIRWDAWEVAARYTGLDVDPDVFTIRFADPAKSAQSARAWAVGLNWHPTYFIRIQIDYEQTHFKEGSPGGDRPTEKVFEQRVYVTF